MIDQRSLQNYFCREEQIEKDTYVELTKVFTTKKVSQR